MRLPSVRVRHERSYDQKIYDAKRESRGRMDEAVYAHLEQREDFLSAHEAQHFRLNLPFNVQSSQR